MNIDTTIVVKSTIPIGFIDQMRNLYRNINIFFSPEFLREGKALYDNLYPSRIIIGDKSKRAVLFSKLLKDSSMKKDVVVKLTGTLEAEAIKLFSNAYLAMRVAYFNEVDNFMEFNGLDSKDVIDGICLDSRIGDFYNNPSFGYGGYCLSKDTKQLLANYSDVPQNIISAIVESNNTRKLHVADMILKHNCKNIGIYRLTMKMDSDNFRSSAVIDIISILNNRGINVYIYEPNIKTEEFMGNIVLNELSLFKKKCDLIVSNRISEDLNDVLEKVYTRDLYNNN